MPYREVNGIKLHLQEIGRGRPIVLTHGLLGDNLCSWFFTAAPAFSVNRRVILHDLRGHGMSDRVPTGFDLETLVEDLHSLLETLCPDEPVDLGGTSYGGLISLKYAIKYPSRARGLVMIDPPLPPKTLAEIQSLRDSSLWELWMALPSNIRRSLSGSPRRVKRFVDEVRFLAEESTLVHDLCSEPALDEEELRSVACPVLLLTGSKSPCHQDSLRLAGLMPHARLETLEGGHDLLHECTKQVTQRMEEFFNGR